MEDLVSYVWMWLGEKPMLSEAVRQLAVRNQTAALNGNRGLGWVCRYDPYDHTGDLWPETTVGHTGFTGTSLAFDPVSKLWMILLTNDVHYGRDKKTIIRLRGRWIRDRAAAVYGISHPNALIPAVYGSEKPVNRVAEFGKEVVVLGDEDVVANGIIQNVIAEYDQLIHAVMRQLGGLKECTTVLAGGLFTNSTVLAERLKAANPELHFEVLSQSAASGAVLRAIKGFYQSSGRSESDAIFLWQSNMGG